MFISYQQTIDYLYASLPLFQRVGAVAYKKDLTNTIQLCIAIGNPHHKFKSIHVAGTNGKGSTSHMLASVLQSSGYKTGLYTSPHLKDFTERIKINGQEIDRSFIVDFVNRIKPSIEVIQPSFFEITVAMAFDYFAQQHVDIAVIEVGLGGRLDSTNIITPEVSVITNISYDHKDLLGNTLELIAAEKAGIIKEGVPVVISERQQEVEQVFIEKTLDVKAPLYFAQDNIRVIANADALEVYVDNNVYISELQLPLKGNYQTKNLPGVFMVLQLLKQKGYQITKESLIDGLEKTVRQTGLMGRWQQLGERPLVVCDTGHNVAGIQEVVEQLKRQKFNQLFIILGMVRDKEIDEVLRLLPKQARYYFCQANIPRAMEAQDLKERADMFGLDGSVVPDVNDAIRKAKALAVPQDVIFIGGSTFVVAEIDLL